MHPNAHVSLLLLLLDNLPILLTRRYRKDIFVEHRSELHVRNIRRHRNRRIPRIKIDLDSAYIQIAILVSLLGA